MAKKIIDGKLYDTEKAEKIVEHDSGQCGSFWYISETLYRTPVTKKFFMHGIGGCFTTYSTCGGDNRSGGWDIRPMDESEVKAWLEKVKDVETYTKLFGEPEPA